MLDRLTITGPDDKTDIDTLLQLSQYYPFVEWAILYSPTRQGSERYPSEEWRKSFEDACRGTRVKRAMHLCGQAVKDFVEKGPEKVPRRNYQRIQLNFNAKTSTWQKEKNIDWMVNQCSWAEFWDGSPQNVVIQHNHNNAPILPKFERLGSQFHVLYDASGGHARPSPRCRVLGSNRTPATPVVSTRTMLWRFSKKSARSMTKASGWTWKVGFALRMTNGTPPRSINCCVSCSHWWGCKP